MQFAKQIIGIYIKSRWGITSTMLINVAVSLLFHRRAAYTGADVLASYRGNRSSFRSCGVSYPSFPARLAPNSAYLPYGRLFVNCLDCPCNGKIQFTA